MSLHLLPLMYIYELNDIIFFIKSHKQPSSHFNITEYIKFSTSRLIRQSGSSQMFFKPFTKLLLSSFAKVVELTTTNRYISFHKYHQRQTVQVHVESFYWTVWWLQCSYLSLSLSLWSLFISLKASNLHRTDFTYCNLLFNNCVV